MVPVLNLALCCTGLARQVKGTPSLPAKLSVRSSASIKVVLYNLFLFSSIFQEFGRLVFPFYSYPSLSPNIWIPVRFLPLLWQRWAGASVRMECSDLGSCREHVRVSGVVSMWSRDAPGAVWSEVLRPGCPVIGTTS